MNGTAPITRDDALADPEVRGRIKTILFRSGVGLGDTLVCEPIVRALRAHLPHAKLFVMTPETSYPLKDLGFAADEFVKYEWPICPPEIAAGYDLVVDVDPGSFREAFHETWENGTEYYRLFAHFRPEAPDTLAYLRIQEGLERAGAPMAFDAPTLHVPAEDQSAADLWLSVNGIVVGERPILAIHPGSGWPHKRWMPESFAAVVDYMVQAYGAAILLMGANQEAELVDATRAAMTVNENVFDIIDWPLTRTAGLIARSTIFLGNEAGMGHVAASVGATVVTVSGPTNAPMWTPATNRALLRPRIPCCRKPVECDIACLRSVTVYDVMGAIEALLTEVIGRDAFPGMDRVGVTEQLRMFDLRDGVVLQNSVWGIPLQIPRGGDYVFEVLKTLEQTHSLAAALERAPDALPLLSLLVRHGIVEPHPVHRNAAIRTSHQED